MFLRLSRVFGVDRLGRSFLFILAFIFFIFSLRFFEFWGLVRGFYSGFFWVRLFFMIKFYSFVGFVFI